MIRRTHIWTLLLLLPLLSCRNETDHASEVRQAEADGQHLQIGISYYPERRPREEWNVDFEALVEAGIRRIRIGEFAWSTLEPEEGHFDFYCFDECIQLAERYGIEVMMCTPTAAPPIWLVETHPEILPVNADGQRNVFGARQHRCYNAPAYLEHSRIIVEKLAARYAAHPNVVAWQIDNEMGGEQKRCHCPLCAEAFHHYLELGYGDVESLNKRWGNAFWSLDYQDFRQVVLPMRYNATLMLKHHPSLELEFSRFCSASIVEYCRMQAAIIRKFNPDALVSTNRFAYEWGDNVDAHALNEGLDAAGFDLYSTSRHQIAFYADLNRQLNEERNWVLEYGTHSHELASELELLESRGVQWVYLFKLNPFPAGMEQSNRALLDITGRPTENYQVIKDWNGDGERQHLHADDASTGIYYDFDCSWALAQEGWGSYREKLVYQAYLIDTVYQALFQPWQKISILHHPKEISGLRTLVLSHQILYDEELEQDLMAFLSSGGRVLATHDLFWKNRDNVYLTHTPDIYREVMDREDRFFLEAPEGERTFSYGDGSLVIIPGNAGVETWQQLFEKYRVDQTERP